MSGDSQEITPGRLGGRSQGQAPGNQWPTAGIKLGYSWVDQGKAAEDGQAFFEVVYSRAAVGPGIYISHAQAVRQPLIGFQVAYSGHFLQEEQIGLLLFDQLGEYFQALLQLAMAGPVVPEISAENS